MRMVVTVNRRTVVKSVGATIAAPFLLGGTSRAAEINLRLHHALPATDSLHSGFLAGWASGLREASGGRLEIQMLPAMQLGGAPRQLAGQVRDGMVDMAWIAAAEAGGQFPRLEALQLPFVAARSGLINSQIAQEFADRYAAAEFPGLQPLIAAAGGSSVMHAGRQITNLAELKGARLRPPTPLAGEALHALGAIAVSVPDALLPEALAQGVLDGGLEAWGGAPEVLRELGFHAEFPASPALFVSVYVLVMNKARFAGLPEDIRAVLVERSGLNGARLAGEAFAAQSARSAAEVQGRGGVIVQLPEDERARWAEATKPVVASWVERSRASGFDGDALLADIRGLLAKYEPPPPPPAAPAPPAPPQAAAPAGQPPTLQQGSFTPGAAPPDVSVQPLVPPAGAPVGPAPAQLTPIQPLATP